MSVPLEPNQDALQDNLRRRVEKITGEQTDAHEPAEPEPFASDAAPAHAPTTEDDDDTHEIFSIGAAFGGASGLVDTGLPGIVFVATYAISSSNLRLSLILALGCGVVLAVLRLLKRESLQHALGGFVGVALAAYIANRSGRAVDFYLPGLFINAGYALAYAVSILVRWPLMGLLVAALQQNDLSAWRKDPVLLRAYSRASWLWVAMFGLRLVVQLPLYLADALVPLGIARVAMGWPLFLVTAWLTYIVIKKSVPAGYRVKKLVRNTDADPAAAR